MGKEDIFGAFLPIRMNAIEPVPHGSEAMYLGCKLENKEGLVLAIQMSDDEGNQYFYMAQDLKTLDCDLLP